MMRIVTLVQFVKRQDDLEAEHKVPINSGMLYGWKTVRSN